MSYRVIVGSTYWALNGVNVFSANLVRGLRARGIPAHVLLTEHECSLVHVSEALMPLPEDLPVEVLPSPRPESWGGHWHSMIRYLEGQAPCVYIPNHDWRHSIVCPRLSKGVSVVGVVHSDDPLHYDHVGRLGRFWDAIVTTSPLIADRVAALDSSLVPRLGTVPIGVPVPACPPSRRAQPGEPIRIIYHGVLAQHQKRILDVPAVVGALREQEVPVEVTIVGGGPEEGRLRELCKAYVDEGSARFLGVVPHDRMLSILEDQDVFLMTSEFEGMPNALLEAMGRGCVPVVTQIQSGIPDVVRDGVGGYQVPVGDVATFAARIATLYWDVSLRKSMAEAARQSVIAGGYRVEDMVDGYVDVFERARSAARLGLYRRPPGPLLPPPVEVAGVQILPGEYFDEIRAAEFALSWKARLPSPLLAAGRRGKAGLRRLGLLAGRG